MPLIGQPGLGGSAIQTAAKLSGEEGDNSLLGNVGRFLGRPGFAARSYLRGDVAGGLKNSAQFALDLFTGGFLNRNWSLANLFSETGDITTAQERPEFSDLLDSWGVSTPDKDASPWSRLALDVVGGFVTDPLTFVTLGGGGVAKGALQTTRGAAGMRALGALRETTEGTAKANALIGEVLQEFAASGSRTGRKLVGQPLTAEWLSSKAAEQVIGDRISDFRRIVEARAGERGFRNVLASDPQARVLGVQLAGDAADEAFAGVVKKAGLSNRVPTAVRRKLIAQGVEKPTRKQLMGAFDEAINDAFQSPNPSRLGDLVATRSLFQQAADDALELGRQRVGVGVSGDFVRFSGHAWQGELLELGTAGMERAGLIHTNGAIRFSIPFTKISTGPIAELPGPMRALAGLGGLGFLPAADKGMDVLRNQTLPGLAYKWAPPDVQRWVDDAAGNVLEWAKTELVDKRWSALVPQGLRDLSYRLGGERVRRDFSAAAAVAKAFDGIHPDPARGGETAEAMGKAWFAEQDRIVGQLAAGPPSPVTLRREAAALGATISDVPAWAKKRGDEWGLMFEVAKRRAVAQVAAQTGADPVRLAAAYDDFGQAMAEIPDELVRLGVWSKATANLVYTPHQVSWELHGFLAQAPQNKAYKVALVDAFTKRREYRTAAEFRDRLIELADKHEVPLPDHVRSMDVQENNLAVLMANRLLAHNRTVERWSLFHEAKRQWRVKENATNVDRYLARQLEVVPQRENFVLKVLGGGRFHQPIDRAQIGDALAAGWEVVEREGKPYRVWRWPGLNLFWKPALTLFAPAFHVRNMLSAVYMGAMDPGIGLAGTKALIRTLRDAPLLGLRPIGGRNPGDAALILRALRQEDTLTPALRARLATLKIGNYDATEVIRLARESVVGQSFSDAEVFDGVGRWHQLAMAAGPENLKKLEGVLSGRDLLSRHPWLVRKWRAAVRWPAAVASYVEDTFRLTAYMKLIETGVDPVDASRRVGKAFVNYDVQSPVERAIRDVIPFARYTIASTPMTVGAVARAPRLFNALPGPLLRREEDENTLIPEAASGRPSIPMGRDKDGNPVLATSLGLPFDAAGDVLSVAAQPFDQGRRVLGGMLHPALRAPIEQLTGTNFYFGDEVGSWKQAPRMSETLPRALATAIPSMGASLLAAPFVREVTLPSGATVKEVPGWVNHWLLGAMPWARARSELDRYFDPRKTAGVWAMGAFTGVRYQTVDQKREARRVIERWLKDATDTGQVGKVEAFFARGEVSPEVEEALKAIQDMRKEARAAARGR